MQIPRATILEAKDLAQLKGPVHVRKSLPKSRHFDLGSRDWPMWPDTVLVTG